MRKMDGRKLVYDARAGGYAVGAINFHSEETVQAILAAAEEAASPVIVQIGRAVIPYMGLKRSFDIVRHCEDEMGTPCCVHLDHGSYDEVVEALKLGFDSVMYDGAHLDFEENIATTRGVVEAAHFLGVPVEAELGRIPDAGDAASVDWSDYYTDVDEAARFVEETGVDYLAVSVGIVHGVSSEGVPPLDVERIEAIARKTGIPLVLHGASGLPEETVRRAIEAGIAKMNVDTDLRVAFREGMQEIWREGDRHLEEALAAGSARMRAEAVRKLRLYGSANQADGKLVTEEREGRPEVNDPSLPLRIPD